MKPETIINSMQAPKQVIMYTGLLTSLHIETGMSKIPPQKRKNFHINLLKTILPPPPPPPPIYL